MEKKSTKWQKLSTIVILCLIVIAVTFGILLHRGHEGSTVIYSSYQIAAQIAGAIILLIWFIPFGLIPYLRDDFSRDLKSYLAIATVLMVGVLGAVHIINDDALLLGATLTILVILTLTVRYDRLRQDELLIEVRNIARGASTVKTYQRWDEENLRTITSDARDSLVIVDSNCGEWRFLAAAADNAINSYAERLAIKIYMLDPRKDYGAQRLLEKESHGNRARMKNKDSKEFKELKKNYWETFFRDYGEIKRALDQVESRCTRTKTLLLASEKSQPRRPGLIETKIFIYPTMPCLRAIIVDDSKYIFGWFPLNALNPNHVCFHLCKSSVLTVSDKTAIECLANHVKEIHNDAQLVDEETFKELEEAFENEFPD